VLYRVHRARGPSVFILGDDARDIAMELVRHVQSVLTPDGERIEIRSWGVRSYDAEIRGLGDGWATYRFTSPYFPSAAGARRRPIGRDVGGLLVPWASTLITSSLSHWAESWGFERPANRPVVAVAADVSVRRLSWERPARDERVSRQGFRCTFSSNLLVPPGVGLGAKISEGYGEVELVGLYLPKSDRRPLR